MPVDRPRNVIEQLLGIPAMEPGETLIDGDLTVYCGTYEGIRFIEDGPVVCPRQRGAEPCDCHDCRRTITCR